MCVYTCVSMIGGYPGYEGMLHAEGCHDYGQGIEPKVCDHTSSLTDSEMSDNTRTQTVRHHPTIP